MIQYLVMCEFINARLTWFYYIFIFRWFHPSASDILSFSSVVAYYLSHKPSLSVNSCKTSKKFTLNMANNQRGGGIQRPNGSSQNKICQFKLVLLGESAVGKSSLVLRFVKGQFHEYQESTIGAAFLTQTVHIDDTAVKFEIWVSCCWRDEFCLMFTNYLWYFLTF